jgi:NifU-like protein involved in Fe-S cluster formation
MANYSSRVLEHFFNPRNPGEIELPSGEGYSGSPSERNYMHLTIRVVDGVIMEARFQCYTCLVAVAACSFLTEIVKGKTPEEVERITPEAIAAGLGEVPPERMDRCVLAVEALRNAIADYRKRKTN